MSRLLHRLLPLAALLLLCAGEVREAAAHSGKARFHMIIDTDGAADDLRTLLLLLGNREAEVLAIVSSEGALPPAETALKADALCADLYHEGIPIGVGRPVEGEVPAWREHSGQVIWGNRASTTTEFPSAVELIATTLEDEEAQVVYVALGALTNLNDLLTAHPSLKEKLQRVVWYDSPADPESGANYKADPQAARQVLESGLRIDIIGANPHHPLIITPALIDTIATAHTPYARKIVSSHTTAPLAALVKARHLEAWDDLVALYLYAPELFDCTALSDSVKRCVLKESAQEAALREMKRILHGRPDAETRVFYGFPTGHSLYDKEVQPIIDSALLLHGESEWRAGVLTNELHGHLGIYATVGVKMGIRAREYFNIGVDDIMVVSYAGHKPPVSCMNDGLQVAAGSTLDHGLIRVADTDHPRPAADFSFKGKTIRLSLKPRYAERIARDVRHGILTYGFETEPYWQYIRQLALRYWLRFDRHDLFEMEVVQ